MMLRTFHARERRGARAQFSEVGYGVHVCGDRGVVLSQWGRGEGPQNLISRPHPPEGWDFPRRYMGAFPVFPGVSPTS